MKRVYISICLLIVSFSFCIFTFSYIQKNFSAFDGILEESISLTENQSYAESAEKLRQAADFWTKKEKAFKFLIDLEHCENIENHLDTAALFINGREYTEAGKAIKECRDILRQVIESESISFDIIL